MSPNARIWTTAAVAFGIGVALAAGGTYLAMQSQVKAAQAEQTQTVETLSDALERIAALEAAASAVPTNEPEPAEEPTTVPKAETPAAPTATRQFTFVTDVSWGSSPSMKADYAQFLTGDEAADAAAARGDESPPPNDFYIVNDNKQLRTLKVSPRAKVQLVTNPDGTSDPSGYASDLETWSNYYAAPSDENAAIRQAGYWITMKGDVVIAIEEQFLP